MWKSPPRCRRSTMPRRSRRSTVPNLKNGADCGSFSGGRQRIRGRRESNDDATARCAHSVGPNTAARGDGAMDADRMSLDQPERLPAYFEKKAAHVTPEQWLEYEPLAYEVRMLGAVAR